MHTIPDKHKVHLIGDYHGEIELLIENLKTLSSEAQPSSIVFLGDYDIHTAAQLSDFEQVLSQFDVPCYLMRGNHDNPNLWQDRGIAELFETSKFNLLQDVDVLEWRGKRILTIGGAVSVDRTCLRFDDGHCWPEIEGIDPNAIAKVKKLAQKGGAFDIMLSHTGPLTDVPIKNHFTQSFASTDDFLLDDLGKERKLISQLLIASGVQESYFGHFHQKWTGEEFGVKLRCLDICEVIEL